ncbi:MAG: RluA family pseudouridine synthase [Acholeplasmataceae bacterium]|nr:RluA family pseudouridine synthase [Acholeplasmataceae bacterium]
MFTPEIIFEDNQILVSLKPPGILSQPSSLEVSDMLTALKEYLKIRHDKPGNVFLGLVHRLDLNVGGVMVFAKTSKAAARLSASIRNKEFKKTYLAVVEGELTSGSSGEFVDYLKKDVNQMKALVTEDGGKLASLSYRSIMVGNSIGSASTLVEIDLHTGRFHQIRFQFASRGHPVLNDIKYGARMLLEEDIIALWAYKLAFVHPVSKDWLTFQVDPKNPLFAAFSGAIKQIK